MCYTAFIQEQSLGIHHNTGSDMLDYVVADKGFSYDDGHLKIPDGSGLGNRDRRGGGREKAQKGHRWRAPLWRHADGSIAEWQIAL